ncbi:MAG: HD domain-containing protein [Methanobacteriota archaeon]
MVEKYKVVRDPIHGNIKFDGLFVDLLDTLEVQRLYNIKQLGFAHLVFPGAHHTRFEHSLGAYTLASQFTEHLQMQKDESFLVRCAALLHDIGHGPFSHTLEAILLEKFGVDHVKVTEQLILGECDIVEPWEKQSIQVRPVFDLLAEYGVNHKEIVDIIRGMTPKKPYLGQIVNSAIDVDQLDYLMRDAYYTGVAYGMIDVERLLETSVIHESRFAVNRKGVHVVENILLARGLMYSSVYFHKTVRIAELMLSKAIQELSHAEPFEFFRMTDAEIINELKKQGRFQQEMVTRLKYRQLFKQAYAASLYELDTEQLRVLTGLEDVKKRREKEQELEDFFKIPAGHVIIDVPRAELLKAEPRINNTDIRVVDNGKAMSLDDFTSIAAAIRSRVTPDWVVMIVTDERYRDVVSEKVGNVLYT